MTAPTLTTQYVAQVTAIAAIGNGNVSSDGAQTITDRGVVVATTVNPTTANSKFATSGTTGAYSVAIAGLTGNTIYHCRAYATNAGGTSYGADIQFRTAMSFTDIVSHSAILTNQSLHTATLTNIQL